MNDSTETLRKKLTGFIQHTSFESLPAEAIHRAKLCLLDLIGVGIAGNRQGVASIVQQIVAAPTESGEVTVWGTDQKLPIPAAAMINAVQGHAIDMDDGHRYANGHPGVATIPAAVALSEGKNLTGRELIEAVVIGYDIFIRLGAAANPELLQRGFHTTATIGSFSSAAVSAKLLGLNVGQTENALSLAGLQSAGLLEALSSGEMGKSFQVGKAVQSGVLAGLLARQGADGPVYIFEGEKGFFRAFAGKRCDIDSVCENLGTDFHITNVYFKKHAACRHIHSALDATAEMVARHKLSAGKIASMEIETYSIAKNLTGHLATQESELAAKFSMPIAIALLLVFGQSDSSVYKKQHICDPLVQSIARRITIRVNPERDATYPNHRGAEVTINTKNQSYRHEVIYPKGEPENPLGDEELMDKYRHNARTLYATERVGRIRDIILDLENKDIREMTALLRAPTP